MCYAHMAACLLWALRNASQLFCKSALCNTAEAQAPRTINNANAHTHVCSHAGVCPQTVGHIHASYPACHHTHKHVSLHSPSAFIPARMAHAAATVTCTIMLHRHCTRAFTTRVTTRGQVFGLINHAHATEAKVRELDVSLVVDEKVVGLEVSMDDALRSVQQGWYTLHKQAAAVDCTEHDKP